MSPRPVSSPSSALEPVEFSVEDAILNTWLEDTGNYLQLDPDDLNPLEAPPPDQA